MFSRLLHKILKKEMLLQYNICDNILKVKKNHSTNMLIISLLNVLSALNWAKNTIYL